MGCAVLPDGSGRLCPGSGERERKIIIDASAIRHTKVKKARATDGTNARLGTDDETNIGSAASDEQVYYRFELSAARFSATWINAVNRCRNLADDGGGWRLPTLKEAILIYILWPELQQAGLTGVAGGTATEAGGGGNSYPYVRYSDTGAIVLDAKNVSTDRYFRCIRDLD